MKKPVIDVITKGGLVPVFSNPDPEVCVQVMLALYYGGIRVFELTNRIDDFAVTGKVDVAVKVLKRLMQVIKELGLDMRLGAGTCWTVEDTKQLVDLNLDFVVSPGFDNGVLELCRDAGIPYSPGCSTPTEFKDAAVAMGPGALLKLFPASEHSASYLKAICPTFSGKFDFTVMPTGGMSIANKKDMKPWFETGIVSAIGAGTLVPKELVKGEHWQGITETASNALKRVSKIRKQIAKKQAQAAA